MMHRNRSVNVHQFAMVPRADIPRSGFLIENTHKTTFNAGELVPVYCEEVLPGDSFSLSATMFGRLATPIVPIMDNLYLDTFYFFVPNRLVWDNWKKFCGEQNTPGDSTDYLTPVITAFTPAVGGLADHFGMPIKSVSPMALPFRAYNLIWNEWFRDQNLQAPAIVSKTDGPDAPTNYGVLKRGKRHDYFTSCLPWPQKGESVGIPLGTSATVKLDSSGILGTQPMLMRALDGQSNLSNGNLAVNSGSGLQVETVDGVLDPNGRLFADLSEATAATINQLRQAVQIQKMLERDARGGTRYIEILRSHFGVTSPDARLQRPEYLGGGRTPIMFNPIAQTSGSPGDTGYTDTPLGTLGAMATTLASGHGFSHSFVEHGFVIGLVNVRADINYQQGIRKLWKRQTRSDFYFPAFAQLGEQAVLNNEIFPQGPVADSEVFGYQERWAEYRYHPSKLPGLMRSTAAGTVDAWHLAQRFVTLPTLNATFIEEKPPLERCLAVGAGANGQQLIFDSFFDIKAARPVPAYSIPGLMDHF